MQIPVENPEQLGQVIRGVRRAQQIRQDDLAAMVGASHVTLMNIERGKEGVAFGRVMEVLRELGVRVCLDVPEDIVPLVEQGLRGTTE